jgi:hypothetical protein
MTLSTAIQTPIERPSIELASVRIFASRDGDRVTGRVEFPYSVGGRTSVVILYRNRAPEPRPSGSGPFDIRHSMIDNQAEARLSLVTRWCELCEQNPKTSRISLANQVSDSASIKCSPRSLQAWSRKLDIEGPAGLCDRYAPAPSAVLSLDPQTASDAVLICAWWCFRIGNADRIDTPMMHSAASLLRPSSLHPSVPSSLPIADVLASIDCLYSWPCDRQRFPFKPFARWARYDFETWLFRACDKNDYRRECSTTAPGSVPLRSPQTIRWPDIPDPRSRKRDVYDHATRAAIHNLKSSTLEPSNASSLRPSAPSSPHPLVTWLQSLDPRWRGFFLRVAKGDRHAKFELIATLRLWWDGLPGAVRRDIDARIESWSRDRSRTEMQIATRRVLSLIPRLRAIREELTALSAAAKMVV